MTVADAVALAIAALLLGVAAWTIVARQTFAAAVGFVAYGLVLSLVWVLLSAVDVALTEAAIGALTGVLLLSAAVRLRPDEARAAAERPSAAMRGAAALLCVVISAGLGAAVLAVPDPAPSLAPQAAQHLAATGLGNPVTAVLMAYRAIDTLLEKVVLVAALLAVWSLAPDRFFGGRPGARRRLERDDPLAFLAQVLPPIGIAVGIYLLWTSADNPGGAFQGGTLLAAMWLLARMAGLVDAPAIGGRWLRLALVGGPLAFLAAGFAGFAWAAGFLSWPAGWEKPLIVAVEIPMLLSIAVTLALLVEGPPARRPTRGSADAQRAEGERRPEPERERRASARSGGAREPEP